MTRQFGAAILACSGPTLRPDERRFFADAHPFGFILFSRNLETTDQIIALTSELRSTVGWQAPIFIDQEGGRVQRMRPPLARNWPPPLDHVALAGETAADAMALRYRIIAAELHQLGIDGNCVPALDVAQPHTHPVLRNRLLGDNPARVAAIGRAIVDAVLDSGALPVIKHMPGHGRGTADSHLSLPTVSAPRTALEQDFAPFRALADAPLGMTAHLVYSAIDDRPATVSPYMIELIRRDIGFRGLLMTDDISMQALSGSVAERGAAARAAGCDLVLHCNGALAEMQALMAEIGTMGPPGQARADAALAARIPAGPVDIAALEAKLEALTRQGTP